MVTRACISINNRCNLNCTYCHFHEKKDYIQEDNMDVITILPAYKGWKSHLACKERNCFR